jgi:hypothetical protein
MNHESGWGFRAVVALMALLCASGAFGQMYEPDDEDAIPPAPIPRAHMHPHPMYDSRDEPPMEPDPDRFPRRGARMMPGEDVDRLPLPPPPIERSGPRPMPMEPDFERMPPRERNSARLMGPGPLEEAPRARPRAIVPPPAPKEAQLRNDQTRTTRAVSNTLDSKSKPIARPVAAVRNESPPAARVAPPPPPPRPSAATQSPPPAPAPTPTPVAVHVSRAPETVVKPRSDLDNVSDFVNKGEGKFNLEK